MKKVRKIGMRELSTYRLKDYDDSGAECSYCGRHLLSGYDHDSQPYCSWECLYWSVRSDSPEPRYCIPLDAGLASTDTSVAKRLSDLVEAIGAINNNVVKGDILEKLGRVYSSLISSLRREGWRVRIVKDRLTVLPPVKVPAKKERRTA